MRSIATTLLDIAGVALVATGFAWLIWDWSPGVALITAGLFLTISSMIASRPPRSPVGSEDA